MSQLTFNRLQQYKQDNQHETVTSGKFYPVIDLNQMREAMRIDSTITSERLYQVATEAVIYVNQQLHNIEQQAVIHHWQTLADSIPQQINGNNLAETHYRHAVYNHAKALLSERYSDYDATGKTASRTDAKLQHADDYRRECYYAIADLLGQQRIDSELI